MTVVEKKISEIRPYENNPRKNDAAVEYVANSIREFGWKVPIVIDKDGVIVAGHTRYKAAQKLGKTTAPCVVADDLTPEQVKAYRLADNKVAELATWDFSELEFELADLEDLFDMSEFGFFDADEEPDFSDDEEETKQEPPEEPKSKRGDIYQLGRHRLMCGDSTSLEDVHALVNGREMDLLITDPPYNVDYTGKTKDALKIQNDSMEDETFRLFLRDAYTAADSVMKPGAVFYIWHADSEGYNFRGAAHDMGWTVRQCLIWVKNSMVMGRQDYQWQHEPCLYGWKDGAAHNWYSDRSQTTLLEFDRPVKSVLHPTMKPLALFDYQIRNSSKKGDAVLDLFGGSGTTLICCEENKRDAYVMELDPRYVDVIVSRWEGQTGQKAVLLNKNEECKEDV